MAGTDTTLGTLKGSPVVDPNMDVTNLTADAETFTANAYYVSGSRPALVDAGTIDGIEDHIDELEVVYLTHQHGDHVGALDGVLEVFDPDVAAWDDHPARTITLDDGDEVEIGDERFAVVHTPGHAPDHVSFVGDHALFSGDVVVYNDAAFDDGSFGRTDGPTQSREELIQSLQRLLDRLGDDVSAMYAGHGDVYEGDVAAVVERALRRAERREPKYED